MGTDCATLVVDLLYFPLSLMLRKVLIRNDLLLARKFKGTYMYINIIYLLQRVVIIIVHLGLKISTVAGRYTTHHYDKIFCTHGHSTPAYSVLITQLIGYKHSTRVTETRVGLLDAL